MLRSVTSRRALLSALCASFLLVGCGGGSSDDGGRSSDLYGAYASINAGMSLEEVTAIVGFAHSIPPTVGRTKTEYVWDPQGDPDTWSILAVSLASTGVVSKSITGYKGIMQQQY
ncbi:MAG: hypothetical protein ACK40L_05900 [Hydrogenophaga sp.]